MRYVFEEDVFKKLTFYNDPDFAFSGRSVHFTETIQIKGCRIKEFDVFGMYCFSGMGIHDCEFDCIINWESGGHNRKPIIIANCVFNRFVSFEDCYFEDEVILKNVVFAEGTNLLGNKGTPVRVGFDKILVMEAVTGEVDVNTFDKALKIEK
jgi:hypothetical protein